MLRLVYCIVLVWSYIFVSAQNTYFQQEVNYNIDVTLNDEKHELSAFEKIQYINQSNTSLNFIYFHLWPNAYKNKETALAKQLLQHGETKMYYAKDEDLGYIDSLNFLVDGEQIKWEYDAEHIDVCKLYLNKPLKSLDTIFITTPFHVKLPSAKLSRLGHIEQAYAITQWYPKPAVYDRDGWHEMPYLNQGEFYSEFGSFDVKITLPKNYVLAATGDRIDEPEEELWLNDKVIETEKLVTDKNFSSDNSFPASSTEYKTIQFKQYRVHDFAWFADKRFHVLKGETRLPHSGNKVDTWAFFTNSEPTLWSKSIEYINDATGFYSELNGDYPYHHVTAIDGTISAGGGMEYPNITIIGESNNAFTLETTIMHEVGHNWYYGILGSNEREFPFLDEGLNSFYEMRYIRSKYPNEKLTSLLGKDTTFKFFGLNKLKHKAEYELAYLYAARKNIDQPIFQSADKFTSYNYGGIVYSKSALVFDYLMNYLGQEKFDQAMQFYFENWKFKHPTPNDLIKTLEYYLNTDLSWFVNEMLLSSKKIDYRIMAHRELSDHSHAVLIKNNSNVFGPVALSAFKNKKLVGTVWYNAFEGKRVFEFPPSEIDEFRIDADQFIPEIDRKNNVMRTKGVFKRIEPIKLSFLGKIDNPLYNQLNFLPIGGYNQYNKLMLGCAFYNYNFLQKKVEFTIAPMFALGNKTVVGYADIARNILPNSNAIQQITLKAKVKSFSHYFENTQPFNDEHSTTYQSFNLNYYKVAGTIDVELKKQDPLSKFTQHVGYTSNFLFVDNLAFNFKDSLPSINKQNTPTIINDAYYTLQNVRVINPYNLKVNFHHNDLFGKLSAEFNYAFTLKGKKSFDVRLFAGTFVYGSQINKQPYLYRTSGYTGAQDYLFDNNFVGRNDLVGLPSAQFAENDGALKVPTFLGQSNTWMLAMNIKSPKIGILPLKLFADIATVDGSSGYLLKDKFFYDAGLNVSLWKNIFEIYIPFAYNKEIKDVMTLNNKGNWYDAIRFTFNLHLIKPRNFISNNLM